jgi:CubicO group peptidase (beta-lactamase class C family)
MTTHLQKSKRALPALLLRNSATSYRPGPGRPIPIEHHTMAGPYAIPAGHLQGTIADLLKFSQALQSGRLLNPRAYEQMVTRVNSNLSGTPGWFDRRTGSYSIITKNGATQGFHSNMALVSGRGDAVVLLWTSRKPKGNNLFRVTNELLHQICHIPMSVHFDGEAEQPD